MTEPAEVNEVIQVTGLSTQADATPPAGDASAPAVPPDSSGVEKPAEQPAAAESAEAETESSSTEPDPVSPEDDVSRETADGAVEQRKPAKGVKKALDRLTRERDEARTQGAQLSGALQTVLAQLQGLSQQRQAPAPQPAQVPTEQPPDRAQYPDWEAFNRATAQYEARQASTQVVQRELGNFVRALVGQQVTNTAQQQAYAKIQRLEQEKAKAPERFADWNEKVVASDAPMSPSLYDAITESADPVLVMHHLGVHPEEHDKLLRMTPKQQLLAVGQIVASANSPPRVSNAPPPARPVSGTKAAQGGAQYSENMTADQHRQWLARQGLTRGIR